MKTDNMGARDGEIPAIFNPKRVRTPSVVVTGDSPNGPFGGFTTGNLPYPQIQHSDSLTSSQPDGAESVTGVQIITNIGQCRTSTPTPTGELPSITTTRPPRLKACKDSCCSPLAQKMYFGVCVTILVTASWVGATHCIKFLYIRRSSFPTPAFIQPNTIVSDNGINHVNIPTLNHHHTIVNDTHKVYLHSSNMTEINTFTKFNAPFFASWFITNFAVLFFPIYLLGRITVKKCESPGDILGDVLRGFRDRGFTAGRFLNRCLTFCILWLITTYLYTLSLRALLATDVMALFATNVASVYLLSWVILHEQFVGVRIVAVILCDTGIALLAYMDGITGSPTLAGVVLAALAAASYAVFKVMFRKMMGDPPVGQIAFTFTTLGFLNAAMLWPVCVGLYFSGAEVMPWDTLPWAILLIASILLLVFHILTQFSNAVTYNMFVTLGLITAVPVSAALDVVLYGANFAGMKLAGIILIAVGFFLVMFPDNWPDYITRLLRKIGRALLRYQCCCEYADIDYENSKYHLVGSQREMGTSSPKRPSWGTPARCHRLSDGLHSFSPTFSVRPCEMTELYSPTNSNTNTNTNNNSHHNTTGTATAAAAATTTRITNTMETFFIRTANKREEHRDSYGSLE